MISSFSLFRRSKSSSINKPAINHPCICKKLPSIDLSTGSPLEPTTSNSSSVSNSSTSSFAYEPPCPNGGSEFPILLPNEVLLQKFSNRKSSLRVSKWKVQQQRLKCRRCCMVDKKGNTLVEECEGLAGNTGDSPCITQDTTENCHNELTDTTVTGVVYVTSERIIFVPKSEEYKGYTLDITNLSSMKAIESTKRVWFFACYKDNNSIATIPFSTQSRCQAFLRLIKNIRFEHMVRRCLPPRYTPGEYSNQEDEVEYTLSTGETISTTSPDEWWYGDNQLPTYTESEEALHKYLNTLGLLTETEPLDRTERISRLIALATVPQSVSLESTLPTPPTTNTSSNNRLVTTIPDAYHSPYVWF